MLYKILTALLLLGICCRFAYGEELTLERALDLARSNNLQITAAEHRYQSSLEQVKSAFSLANPELVVSPTILGKEGSDTEMELVQPLEINGRRSLRTSYARSRSLEEKALFDMEVLDIELRVKELYWTLVKSSALERQYREELSYMEIFKEKVEKQIRSGAVAAYQLEKAELELFKVKHTYHQIALEAENNRRELFLQINVPDSYAEPSQSYPYISADLPKDTLLAYAMRFRPEIAAAQARIDAAVYERKLAEKKMWPDLELQARKEHFNSRPGVALAVTLPLWDWGGVSHEIRGAQKIVKSNQILYEQAQKQVVFDLDTAYDALLSSCRILSDYDGAIGEKSKRLAEIAEKGYSHGAMTYLDVLEARRTYLTTVTSGIEALTNYYIALAKLERACGISLAEIVKMEDENVDKK